MNVDPPGQTQSLTEAPERITFRHVLRSCLRALSDLDFASVRTVIGLARQPGGTALAYIRGERTRLMNPVKFAFLASTLYILVNALTTRSEIEAVIDPLMAYRGFWPYVSLVLLLPAAAGQRLLFRGGRLNAAECYTFGLFVFGELALVGSVLLAIQWSVAAALPTWLSLTLVGAYSCWAVTGLYQDRRLAVWLRALVVVGSVVGALAAILYALQWYRFSGLG